MKYLSFRVFMTLLLVASFKQAFADEMELLFGDTHLHTAYSFDAFLNDNQSAYPDTAYRWARGLPVIHPYTRTRVQINTPLDFLVVSDHAEYLGVITELAKDPDQLTDLGFFGNLIRDIQIRFALFLIEIGRAEDVFNNIPSWLGLNSTSQAITGDGSTSNAIDVTSAVTEVDATSAQAPCTLADGANGQIKVIINVSTGGSNNVVITPSNLRGGTTITLNAPGETVTCIFKNSNWNVIGGFGFAVA